MTDPEGDTASGGQDTDDTHRAVVLDHLRHGRADDDRPQYKKSPLAQALGEKSFTLYQMTLTEDADVSIGDRLQTEPPAESIQRMRELEYPDLTGGAKNELEYVVREIVDDNEQRFLNFYSNAKPITLRLHQLNLLPGIGEKLRNNILDERKRGPFESFEDLEERITGLHSPAEVLVERIVEELSEDDLKYKTFVGRESFVADE
jgi:putative nucleotide binding protein